jgi:hypothetical protein
MVNSIKCDIKTKGSEVSLPGALPVVGTEARLEWAEESETRESRNNKCEKLFYFLLLSELILYYVIVTFF